jgi:hypothetical protein
MSSFERCYDKFAEMPRIFKLGVLVVFLTALWLGIHSLVIVVEGNRNPSLPMSTPCPVLNYSTLTSPGNMPLMYALPASCIEIL